ncbi:response regulator [Aureimonas populi]|uniref:Response regulator n=1 Tax=Aureimonas populi TaxID=1701758 RepID=A0ABW5CIS5_9HYPH|nr:response regulator [Aureimonas populi]
MSTAPNILIVDDHREIRDALKRYLERNGFRTSAVDSARAMDKAMSESRYDLVVLDVMMPGEDGLSACRRLRVESDVAVLMLTALGEDTDRIIGLEVGADDYLPKPFNPREVLARIKAILRRTERAPVSLGGQYGGKKLLFDRWTLDVDRRILIDAGGEEAVLTTGDYQLLVAFLERPRIILSRDRLLDLTSGREAAPFDRAIDNQVSRLRRKIERDAASPELISTVRGGGYCFMSDVTESA